MVKKSFLFLSVLLLLAFFVCPAEVDEKIYEELDEKGFAEVIVRLKETEKKSGLKISAISDKLRGKKAIVEQQDKVLSKLDTMSRKRGILSIKEKKDFELRRKYSTISAFSGKVSKEALETLSKDRNVESIQVNSIKRIALSESVPLINGDDVWKLQLSDTNLTGKHETICVLDTGIDTDHPAFLGRILDQYCYCSLTNSGDGQYCCPDDTAEDDSAEDDHGHGTHCTGIAAGNHSANKGMAPDAGIIAIKVCNSTGSCADSDIIAGIDWCTANASKYNISVISISIGGDGPYNSYCDSAESAFADSINSAVGENISVFIASGNDNWENGISSPACIENATPVGSTNDGSSGTTEDDISSFTNRGSILDLMAPGKWITSPWNNGGTATYSGTSMAAPHAAGAAALINQFTRLYNSSVFSPVQIESILNSTGKSIYDSGSGRYYSRIDIAAAIFSLDNSPPNITFSSPSPNITTANTSVLINASAYDSLKIDSCILEWNYTNESMNKQGSGKTVNCYLNKSINGSGLFYYRVYANDSGNNFNSTPLRWVNITNTAPNITGYYPGNIELSIAEPGNQTFNITYEDANNDEINITWYKNSTVVSGNSSYTFYGNYSASGFYNITVVITDNELSDRLAWNFTVNNTNAVPLIQNPSLACSDPLNRTNGSLNAAFSIYDPDSQIITNETRWYNNSQEIESLRNLTSVSSQNTTKNQNWTFSVRAYDQFNYSNWQNITITIKNAPPILKYTAATILNETDQLNISVNITDIDLDYVNISINNSNFINTSFNRTGISSAVFTWNTTTSDAGYYAFNITANDSQDISSFLVHATILNAVDSDGDGLPDYKDTDDDNDNLNDNIDFLKGNSSSISAANVNVSVFINNSISLAKIFNSTLPVNITDANNNTVVYFNFTFNSSNILDLYNMTIAKHNSTAANSSILIRGISLRAQNTTKTVYLERILNSTGICIKDSEIPSIGNISSACTAPGETWLACPGSNANYSCVFSNRNTKYKVTGLFHSGIREQAYYCGDSVCNGDESCSSCPADCSCPVRSVSSASGGSGSGGGKSISLPSDESTLSGSFLSMIEGEEYIIRGRKEKLAVTQLNFFVNSFILKGSVIINVSSPKNKTPLKNAYQYFQITAGAKLTPQNIKGAGLEFRVKKAWLEEYDKNKVKLLRLSREWQHYPAKLLEEDADYAYYSSNIPGFSYFAVTAERKEEKIIAEEEKAEEKEPETKTTAGNIIKKGKTRQEKNSFLLYLLLFIILAAAMLLLYLKRRGKASEILIRHIKLRKSRKLSKQEITKQLISQGWEKSRIKQAFRRINPKK
ncbi:S8 family serine peptidase [Candidatus Woesearchaeota archaeon]|nr:S8 family serine peptidase [Candidatus Woesearchaeota archaeon]